MIICYHDNDNNNQIKEINVNYKDALRFPGKCNTCLKSIKKNPERFTDIIKSWRKNISNTLEVKIR